MSDADQGSGWWQASDGRWYPPDVHPWQQGASPARDLDAFETRIRPSNGAAAPTNPGGPQPLAAPETIRADMPPEFLRLPAHTSNDTTVVRGGIAPTSPPSGWGQASAEPLLGRSATAPGGNDPAMRTYLDPRVAASYKEPLPDPDIAAGILGLLSAAVLAFGSFLVWADASGPTVMTVDGLAGSNGWGTLLAGLVVAMCAGLVLTGRRAASVGAIAMMAGLAAVLVAAYSAVDILRTDDELSLMLIERGVDRATANAASLDLTPSFGLVALGAIGALVAGAIAFARRV